MINNTRNCVLQDWVLGLPFRMQNVLMTAIRGYDLATKDDCSKLITRSIRSLVLNNADLSNSFITQEIPQDEYVSKFLWDIDCYAMHFVMHTTHAIEIIGYKHPELKIRSFYLDLYRKLVKGFHLNYETESQLDVRLGFTSAEGKIILGRSEQWDAGTGTSHGSRQREYSGSS